MMKREDVDTTKTGRCMYGGIVWYGGYGWKVGMAPYQNGTIPGMG